MGNKLFHRRGQKGNFHVSTLALNGGIKKKKREKASLRF